MGWGKRRCGWHGGAEGSELEGRGAGGGAGVAETPWGSVLRVRLILRTGGGPLEGLKQGRDTAGFVLLEGGGSEGTGGRSPRRPDASWESLETGLGWGGAVTGYKHAVVAMPGAVGGTLLHGDSTVS